MRRQQTKQFTLIELLVVIGIIGILATVVIPAVGGAMSDAKRSATQVASKTFEDDMIKYDVANGGMIKAYARTLATGTNSESEQKDTYALLSGNKDFVNGALTDTTNTSTTETDTYTLEQASGVFVEPKISIEAFEPDSNGYYPAAPTTGTGFAKNKFNEPYQFVYRKSADKGTITVAPPGGGSGTYITLKGLKRNESKLRVVSWDDSDPAMLITRDGAYTIKGAKEGTPIATGSELVPKFK